MDVNARGFGWLSERSGEKTDRTMSSPDKRVFFGGKTKSPCFDLFIHWLIKKVTNTYRNHFFMLYENRSISDLNRISAKLSMSVLHLWHQQLVFPKKLIP